MKQDFDKFFSDYVTTALWASIDGDGESLDGLYTIDDIAPESIDVMRIDCIDFHQSFGDIATETDHPGHDFWLTRNGHGAGFWDGDYPQHGDELTANSKAYGECNLYVGDDGLIYCS